MSRCHERQGSIEAFRISQQSGAAYDLICMDIMMPEMDGQAAVLKIREMEESAGVMSTTGAKIIMITALDDVKNVVKSFKALCDAYIFKPVDTAKLLEQLKSLALVA